MRFGDYTPRDALADAADGYCRDADASCAPIRGLVATAMPLIRREGLTMVGITVSNLENDNAVQLPLPFERRARGLWISSWIRCASGSARRP